MNQEITLERCGDAIHLIYRHYRGSFYGNLLGNRLRLTGVDPPANGNGNGHQATGSNGHAMKGLALGQYYQVQIAGEDGEMHALVPESQLADVQQAVVHDLHIPVAAGVELFPPDVTPALEEEKEGRSAGQTLGLILGSLFVLAVLGAAGFVVWRSVAHEDLAMAAFITRMEASPPSAAAPGGLGNAIGKWAEARNVRIPLANVLFLTESKLVLADGAFVAIEGAGDLRALAPLAEKEGAVPLVEARFGPTLAEVVSGSDAAAARALPLKRIRCGGTTFAETGTIKPIAILTPSTGKPVRSAKPARDEGYRIVTDLRFDERRTFASLIQSRISLRGRIVTEESGRVLRLANGTGVALAALPDGSRVQPFLAGIAGDKSEIQVDLVFERAFPWKNAKHPAESREATRIAGMGRVLSVSADGLFLTDER
jgi:hypothetical protein